MRRINLVVTFALALLIGCGGDDLPDCLRSADCLKSERCEAGRCVATTLGVYGSDDPKPGPIVVAPTDASGSFDPTDAGPTEPPCRPASLGELQIEEILADVPPAPDGDANNDGIRDAYDDEFVEIISKSEEVIGLADVELRINGVAKFIFDSDACIAPSQALVIFADAPVTEDVRSAGKRLSLGNSGGTVELVRGSSVFDAVEYPGDANGSWVRFPPVSGPLVRHADVALTLFSPGRCPSGAPWDGRCDLPSDEMTDAGL